MSLDPDEVKESMKKATEVLWSIRESLGFPVLRKPLIQFAQQLRGRQLIQPPLSPEQIEMLERENIQERVEIEESPRTVRTTRQPTYRETIPLSQLPRLPLPLGLRQRVEKIKLMPIRRGIGEVLRSYSQYISSPRQRKREEEEEVYEERVREPSDSKLAEARLKRKGVYKGHSLEM